MDKFLPVRKRLRLDSYDYSLPGSYFITICTANRTRLFGSIDDKKMHLNDLGRAVETAWRRLPAYAPYVSIDEFSVMPDHLHGIVVLVERGQKQSLGIPGIMQRFKSWTTSLFRRDYHGGELWQRGYYDEIIRTERKLNHVKQYIRSNPEHWDPTL